MEKTLKAPNYTPEQTATIVAGYQAGETVEALALKIGKGVRSVVAKLTKEKVYVAKTKVAAADRVTKAVLISQIAAKVGSTDEALESLEKATKDALQLLADSL